MTSSDATSISRVTGRAKSCVVCRQFKLACDARRTAPNSCSRCVSKSLVCRFDPNFKRISTRKIAQEVADELHSLRAARHTDSGSLANTPYPHLVLGGHSPAALDASKASGSSNSSLGINQGAIQASWVDLNDDEIVLDQSLFGVTVSSTRILKLFYHFDRCYYPHARFLATLRSVNGLAQRSPLLFWSVLLTACSMFERHDGLYEQLCSVHSQLLGEVLHQAIQSLETIHAFLLLCLWPIPKLRNSYDPSWNYIGLAIQAATSLNCHNPLENDQVIAHYKGASDTSAAEMNPAVQAMTWLYCFKIGARQSAYLGLPPPICSPQYSKSLKRAQQLAAGVSTPEECIHIKMLDLFCSAQVHLDNLSDLHSNFSMTESFLQQLETLRTLSHENWGLALEVQYQAIILYVLGITFTVGYQQDDHQAIAYQQTSLQKCLNASCSFVSTMTTISNQEVPGHNFWSGELTFYPKHYFTSLMMAAAMLFRFLIASTTATQSQQSLAITRLTEAHKIFQSFPDHRDAVRACINIEAFIHVLRTTKSETTDLLVNNRYGASVMHDATFRAAQQRNTNPNDGFNRPVPQWSMMNDDNAHRLPLAPEQKVASPKSGDRSTQYMDAGMPMAMGIWDIYSNDFGMLSEPWVGDDSEFGGMMFTVADTQNQYLPARTVPIVAAMAATRSGSQ